MKKLASVRNTDTANANTKRMELADEFARGIFRLVEDDLKYDVLADSNFREVNNYQIAKVLNDHGHTTRFGKRWTQNAVKLIYDRVRERGLDEE